MIIRTGIVIESCSVICTIVLCALALREGVARYCCCCPGVRWLPQPLLGFRTLGSRCLGLGFFGKLLFFDASV